VTRERLWRRELVAQISKQGWPAPIAASKRWVVERTSSSWSNAHKKLVCSTERLGSVIDFLGRLLGGNRRLVGRMIRRGWTR
jgi:hypothetical protein